MTDHYLVSTLSIYKIMYRDSYHLVGIRIATSVNRTNTLIDSPNQPETFCSDAQHPQSRRLNDLVRHKLYLLNQVLIMRTVHSHSRPLPVKGCSIVPGQFWVRVALLTCNKAETCGSEACSRARTRESGDGMYMCGPPIGQSIERGSEYGIAIVLLRAQESRQIPCQRCSSSMIVPK